MEELLLSDTELRYFGDLFVCCDTENTGKIPITKAAELIYSGNVTTEVLNQITELCCTKPSNPSNFLNRKQFYSALKLVAAHQANMPLKPEILTSNLDLPLPRFTWPNSENHDSCPDLIELTNSNDHEHKYNTHVDTTTDSEVESRLEHLKNGSPEASSTASDSPTPTNSVQERSWAVSGNWQGLMCEEQRQLLGTEEESSDRHSSEEDTEVSNEVWTITNEQREYYTAQFRSLQPDTNALLAGPIARLFFEKSRLPIAELKKIWQLSDVTKDGALSLQEFNTAMHLVVLRRNHIPLPDVLPPQLVGSLISGGGSGTPLSPSPKTESASTSSPQLTALETSSSNAKEWTKFVDSPTSSISSPGPKPVNFDFQKGAVEKDPKILHPVPLRLTPECAISDSDDTQQIASPKKTHHAENTLAPVPNDIRPIQRPQPKKINIPGPGAIPPPPGPCPEDGPVSLPTFPAAPKKEPPPPPPPRPFKTHGRSSSLDLNRLAKGNSGGSGAGGSGALLGAPPTVPPRVSPSCIKKLINQRSEGGGAACDSDSSFANFVDQFPQEKYENVTDGIFPGDQYEAKREKLFAQFSGESDAPRKHGAFEVYRKPTPKSPISAEDQAKWDLFLKLQEQNKVLLRLCQELSQELADVCEERIALKVKLEQHQSGG